MPAAQRRAETWEAHTCALSRPGIYGKGSGSQRTNMQLACQHHWDCGCTGMRHDRDVLQRLIRMGLRLHEMNMRRSKNGNHWGLTDAFVIEKKADRRREHRETTIELVLLHRASCMALLGRFA